MAYKRQRIVMARWLANASGNNWRISAKRLKDSAEIKKYRALALKPVQGSVSPPKSSLSTLILFCCLLPAVMPMGNLAITPVILIRCNETVNATLRVNLFTGVRGV